MEKFEKSEDVKYKRIYGGVAMPSAKNAGFVVVVGETKELGFQNKTKYVFLDEIEDWDGRSLIRRVGGLDYKYSPVRWFGDVQDVALDKYVDELNRELTSIDELKKKGGGRKLDINFSGLLLGKQDSPFTFIVSDLNELLGGRDRDRDRQRLFLKSGSKLSMYMKLPKETNRVDMRFGDVTALDSLAFAIWGLLEAEAERDRPPRQEYADYQIL